MKCFFKLCFLLISLFLASCSAGPDSIIAIYEKGTSKVVSATTSQELYEVTVGIKKELLSASQGIGGDKKMSINDTRRVLDARNRYEREVEKAAIRLNSPSFNGINMGRIEVTNFFRV